MASAQHTPGPWVGQFDAEDWSVDGPMEGRSMTFEAIGAEGRGYPIAIAVQRDGRIIGSGDAELSANIALLSAAPDLLEACKGMLLEWEKFTRYGSPIAKSANERINLALAAVAKAEGR